MWLEKEKAATMYDRGGGGGSEDWRAPFGLRRTQTGTSYDLSPSNYLDASSLNYPYTGEILFGTHDMTTRSTRRQSRGVVGRFPPATLRGCLLVVVEFVVFLLPPPSRLI